MNLLKWERKKNISKCFNKTDRNQLWSFYEPLLNPNFQRPKNVSNIRRKPLSHTTPSCLGLKAVLLFFIPCDEKFLSHKKHTQRSKSSQGWYLRMDLKRFWDFWHQNKSSKGSQTDHAFDKKSHIRLHRDHYHWEKIYFIIAMNSICIKHHRLLPRP